MEDRKMKIIQELMDQLSSEMEYGKEDLGSRLGRGAPDADVAIMKVEKSPMEGDMDDSGPMPGMAEEEGEDPMMDEDEMGPDMNLKKRLMRLRG